MNEGVACTQNVLVASSELLVRLPATNFIATSKRHQNFSKEGIGSNFLTNFLGQHPYQCMLHICSQVLRVTPRGVKKMIG